MILMPSDSHRSIDKPGQEDSQPERSAEKCEANDQGYKDLEPFSTPTPAPKKGSRCSSNSFDMLNDEIQNTIKDAQEEVLPQDSASQVEEQKYEEEYLYKGFTKAVEHPKN